MAAKRRKTTRRTSRKTTRKTSRKTTRKTARKTTRKTARKTTRRIARKPARKTAKKSKSSAAKGLASKIAELEAKLADMDKPKPAEVKPAEVKPAETAPPPKPAETAPPPPAPEQTSVALHEAFRSIPTGNWNDQKDKVPGYTAPGNKYFATRQRLAYHPEPKKFETWITNSGAQVQVESAPPPPPPPPEPEPQVQESSSGSGKSSKQQELDEYEKGYLERYEKEHGEAKSTAEAGTASKKGAMPKGF